MGAKTLLLAMASLLPIVAAPVAVRYPQGLLHGFLTLRTQDGTLLASGELNQFAKGARMTNQLIFRFQDGSVHEENTVFTQRGTFRLVSYRLVQKGPAFERPTELTLDASSGRVEVRYTEEGKEKTATERMKLPEDISNGLVTTLLNNLSPKAAPAELSMVVSTPKPRLVKLKITPDGSDPYTVAGAAYKSQRFLIHIDIGGISGIIAPIIGKQPPDTRVWISPGVAPGFLTSEGSMCDGCPIWRIQLASPEWK
jgi:hypothetical protein